MNKTSSKHDMIFAEYFPLGLAKSIAFCNRVQEQESLRRNIEAILPTVIIAQRRYGKSSLAVKVIEESTLPYAIVDLFVAKNAQTVEKYILDGVQRLISKVMTTPQQVMKLLKTTLKNLDAKIALGTNGMSFEFAKSNLNHDVAGTILEALQALDEILRKKKICAILFIDEFQQIGVLAKGRGIEGAIRHVAQETRNIVFIFSGSNRHLLAHMFNDSNRPFYKLCQEIHLKCISAEDYTKYLNRVSQKAWGEILPDSVLTEIFNCTDNHPYYMNVLCMRIWMYSKKPNAEMVRKFWEEYVFEERSKTANELNQLTANQYLVLNKIAHGYKKQLTGHLFLSEAKIPSSSVIQALNYLEQNDYVYKKENEYRMVDPLIKSSILFFSKE